MTKTVTQAVEELVRATIRLSDEDMGREWKWGVYDEEGFRFALLMTHHELRDLAVRLAARRDRAPTQAERILAQYHQAYRDLTAVLAPVRSEDLDRAPAEGEWPLRETLLHVIGAEHGFLAVSRYGIVRSRAGNNDEPTQTEFEEFRAPYLAARKTAEAALAKGTIEEIRKELFTIHVRVLRELGDITDTELEAQAWFWDGAMPIRFRLHRFEEHLRQHTIQLDKTLVAIDRAPTEAQRLVRNVYNALADVESSSAKTDELAGSFAEAISDRASAMASIFR